MNGATKDNAAEREGDGQKKRWEHNIKEWTGMDYASSTRAAENSTRWKGNVAKSSVLHLLQAQQALVCLW